jgi:predicted DNA-binding protein (UPF0251 family)
MARPRKDRIVAYNPEVSYFKPRGIPMVDLDEVLLTVDEREAIRLADLLGYSHEDAGERMGVSRATFGRIIQKARLHVADALINGKAINIEGGNYRLVVDRRLFLCQDCNSQWEAPQQSGRPNECPACNGRNFYRFVDREKGKKRCGNT